MFHSADRLSTIFRITISVILLMALPAVATGGEKNSYILAVVPNQPAVTIHKNWTPFMERLSKDTGIQIELKVYEDIDRFLKESGDGVPDIAYFAPNMFFLSYEKQKYIPLVRSEQKFAGQVFVRKDSPYRSVKDLQGKTIAFVGPRNVCSAITRHALNTGAGPIDYNATYSGSTINVAKSVLLGKSDAGATLDLSIIRDAPEIVNELRVIIETEKIASHPLAAHPRVPKKIRDQFTKAILDLDRSDEGKKLLSAVRLVKPILADFKRDYSHFAEVNFDKLDKQPAR